MPALITSNFTPAAGNSILQEYTLTCEISGVQSSSLSAAAPPINYARLVAPYYVANPTIDATLSMKKTFRYLERNVTTFNLGANSNLTVTLSPGITNPKRVVLLPYFTTINSVTYNPLLSPFDTVPGTSSPFAALKDLQILVAGKPAFQNPVQMDYEMFLQEVTSNGIDGGECSMLNSGLLSQTLWDGLYRFYTCNIGRRSENEDGSSKSVIVQCYNATSLPMTVIAMTLFEKEITIDTAMCKISYGKAM